MLKITLHFQKKNKETTNFNCIYTYYFGNCQNNNYITNFEKGLIMEAKKFIFT